MKKRNDKNVDKIIINYVESFFEEIKYSKEAFNTKDKIINILNDEFITLKDKNKQNAFEKLIEKYNTLEKMVKEAGVDTNKIEEWFNKDATTNYTDFEVSFKKERKHIYLVTFLGILCASYLIQSILYFHESFLFSFIFFLIFFVIELIIIKKYRKKNAGKENISVDSYSKTEKLFDKYSKRSINWTFILFLEFFTMILSFITLGVNSKAYEIVELFNNDLFVLEIALFFMIKNILITKYLIKKIDFENEKKYKYSYKSILIFCIIYWIIAVLLYFGFEKVFVVNITAVVSALFVLSIITYNIKYMNRFTYNKFKINKVVFALFLLAFIIIGGYMFMSKDVWLTQPYINSIPHLYNENNKIDYNDENGIYTITMDKKDFKILQLTDIHIGGSAISYDKDYKALNAVYKLIDYSKPDLVVVTGDLSFPVGLASFSFNNTAPVAQFAAFMRNTGVPWAFTYGNHDTESYATSSKDTLDELYKSLSYKTSKTLLYPYVQPKLNGEKIWGRNNQLIEVRNSDGTLNQALFMIDSNAYTSEGLNKYDYIHDDQVKWYKNEIERLNKEEGNTISSLGFFHIPLQEYRTAYELYEEGSSEVKYFFGSNDEKMINKICTSDYPSKLFNTAVELGSTKGFFCGHDHYNNMSLEYKGIRLTYGMSIDYLVMPGIARDTKQRGATLITSHSDSSINIEQIPLTSIEKYYK